MKSAEREWILFKLTRLLIKQTIKNPSYFKQKASTAWWTDTFSTFLTVSSEAFIYSFKIIQCSNSLVCQSMFSMFKATIIYDIEGIPEWLQSLFGIINIVVPILWDDGLQIILPK